MNRIFGFAFISLFATMFYACTTDLNGPVIDVHEPSPQDVISLGSTLHVEADFEDVSDLSQYKITIDGMHQNLSNEAYIVYDSVLSVGSLTNQVDNVHEHFTIPTNILPGPYKVTVFALDTKGNEGKTEVEIILQNDSDHVVPVVNVTSPAAASTVSGTIDVQANITDLMNVPGNGEIRYVSVYLQSSVDGSLIYPLATYSIANLVPPVYDSGTGAFSKIFTIPGNVTAGNYTLNVDVRDRYFNFGHQTVSITVQ